MGVKFKKPQKSHSVLTKAVIDIGSNSIKLRVISKKGNVLRTILDTTEVVRLGRRLDNGLIDAEAMRRGVEVIDKLAELADERGATPRLVGTMVLRIAGNAGEFIQVVRERTGIEVEVLSGEEEARLAWLGATAALGVTVGNTTVFDTGGGSTEFIFGKGAQIVKSLSVPLGAVFLTEKFFASEPIDPESLCAAKEYIRGILASAGEFERNEQSFIIGLGGGVVAMASVKLALPFFSPEALNGVHLTKDDIDNQVALYASSAAAERTKIVGLPPKRADIILASACIVQCAMEVLGINSFKVSINGLRHGLLLEMFKGRALV